MNVFELAAILTLNSSQFEKSLAEAKGQATGFGSGFSKIGKMIAVGLAAGTTAVAALAGKSVAAYADYEQMAGGVRKLYGNMGMTLEEYAQDVGKSTSDVKGEWENLEKAQNMVLDNAKSAYKTAGMSANQYMETATTFSASLINSLDGDTVAAAKQTDVAMKAISDNWNTFGGDISRIQDAYRGFAKSNFTMLDNLSLGYGGTKAEMERLIADANEYAEANGKAADLSIDSFSDIVTAIQYVQEKQHIAGTTANEAGTTIAGSMGMAKAAWENLLTGFSDSEADIGELATNFTESFGTAAGLIIPRFAEAFQGIVMAVPALAEGMASALTENLGGFASSGVAIIQSIGNGLVQGIPNLLSQALPMVVSLSESLRENAGTLVDAGLQFILNLGQGIVNSLPLLIEYAPIIVSNLAGVINDNAPKLLTTGLKLIVMLGKGLVQAVPVLIKNIPAILKAVADAFMAFGWIGIGRKMISGIAKGIKNVAGVAKNAANNVGKAAMNAIQSAFSSARQLGAKMIHALGGAIRGGIGMVVGAARALATGAINTIRTGLSNVGDVGMNLVRGIWNGISNGLGWIKSMISGWVGNVKSFLKSLFGIHSPSTWARDMIGANIVKGMAMGIEDESDLVDSALADLVDVPDFSIGTQSVGANEDLFGMMKSVQMVNNITVDGAENPEEYASRFVRQMQMDMRMV